MAQGFFMLPHAFIEERLHEVNGAELKAYIALRSWADRDGRCFPSVESIAERAGLSRSTAKAALHRLQELGWIRIEVSGRKGSVTRHEYHILAGMKTGPVSSNHRDENQPGRSSTTGPKYDPVNATTGPESNPVTGPKSDFHRAEIQPLTISNEQEPGKQDLSRAAHAKPDPRFQRVLKLILDAYETQNARGKIKPSGKLLGQLKHLLDTLPEMTVEDFQTCIRHRLESDDGSPSELPDAWVSKLAAYREGPLNNFGRLKTTGANCNGERTSNYQQRSTKTTRSLEALRDALIGLDYGPVDTAGARSTSRGVEGTADPVRERTLQLPGT